MNRFSLAAFAAVLLAGISAFAAGPFPQSPSTPAFGPMQGTDLGSSTITSDGPAAVTGNTTSDLRTVTLPDESGQALLRDNGNGTSTLVHPDGRREVVITPY